MTPIQPAEPKPIVTRNSSEFKRDAYASIPSGELVVFAVQVLQADGSPALTEDIVSICFRFFPHSFALKNYFYWPDSALVTRRLHDAKEKGLLKGSAAEGFEAKGPGRHAAKHVAKALGVTFPAPPRVEAPATPPAEKKEEEKKDAGPSTPVVKVARKPALLRLRPHRPGRLSGGQAGKKKEQKKNAVKPVVKKQAAKPKAETKQMPKPRVAAAKTGKKDERRKKIQVKPAPKNPAAKKPMAKVEKNAAKKRETSRGATRSTVKPVVGKVEPKVEAVVGKKQEAGRREAKSAAPPKQLTMPLAPPTAWKKAEGPATKPRSAKEPLSVAEKKPVKAEASTPAASKEERDKAAKVIKQIERSDAYQLYRRNGRRANIGDFDFRNMLFATMESSAETLKRNTELFKRYAGIHFRADLIAFLEFCEEKFSALLATKAKGKR
jgi:hypothetical protein